MIERTRESIETSIRELSFKIREELLEQQKQNQPQRINLVMCEHMLNEWGNLVKYYENSIYRGDTTDTEMSLFIVENYLDWTRNLAIFVGIAHKQNDEYTDELEELLLTLEIHMKDILTTISSIDSMSL